MNTNHKNAFRLLLAFSLLLTQCTKEAAVPKSSAKDIENPTVEGIAGATPVFDPATTTYTVTVPGGTDLKAVKFTFALPPGATAKPTSGNTLDFTNPVTYTITAEDGSTQTFMVKVVYRTTWATLEDRIDAIRLRAQKVTGVMVRADTPRTVGIVTDSDAAYITNMAEFKKGYEDTNTVSWNVIDKPRLEYYFIQLNKASGELLLGKGTIVKFDQYGGVSSYKPIWNIFYSK